MKFLENAKTIEQLMVLYGDFAVPVGEVVKTEDGFEYKNSILSVKSTMTRHKSGVVSRKDVITNISNSDITLHRALSKFTLNGGECEVFTQFSEWCEESQGAWQSLETEISARSDEIRSNSSASPFFAVYNKQNCRGLAFHIMANSAWSYKVRRFFLAKDGYKRSNDVELGLCCDNFSYTLKSGESLCLPEILFYEFLNKTDLDAYKLHRYANQRFPAKSFPIIYNSWMSNFDDISYENLYEQLVKAKELGCEYFVVDAGWFGKPHLWSTSVGDWVEREDFSMKGRMKEFSDKVRELNLKFGLWFEIERATTESESYKNHPEHYLVDGTNAFINFAKKETCDYIFDILAEQIKKYQIEFIKFDFNRAYDTNNYTDAFLEYFRGYRGFIQRINQEFPQIYLENCAGGGTRQSLSNLEGFDSFWMTDNHNLFRELDIFRNCVKRMPPRALEKWITVRSIQNFKPAMGTSEGSEKILMSSDGVWKELVSISEPYLLNSVVGGPIGISCDLTKLSDRLLGSLTEFLRSYKAEENFWKNSECHILTDTASMLILQFNDENFDRVKIFVYAKHIYQNSVTVYPELCRSSDYILSEKTLSASEICESGIEVEIKDHFATDSFELIKK